MYITALQLSIVIVRNFNHRLKCLLSDTTTMQRSVTTVTGIEELPGSYRDHTLSSVRFLVVSMKSSASEYNDRTFSKLRNILLAFLLLSYLICHNQRDKKTQASSQINSMKTESKSITPKRREPNRRHDLTSVQPSQDIRIFFLKINIILLFPQHTKQAFSKDFTIRILYILLSSPYFTLI